MTQNKTYQNLWRLFFFMDYYPVARKSNLVIQETKTEILSYDLVTQKICCLNPTATLIWNLCDGENSVTEIATKLGKQMKETVDKDLVWLALDQLSSHQLLEQSKMANRHFTSLSRRAAIRKIGLASMIMLPAITSLVAPKGISAQSCASPGTIIACDDDATSCNSQGTVRCCSGVAFLGSQGSCPLTGFSECICGSSQSCASPGAVITCDDDATSCNSQGAVRCCSGSASLGTQGSCPLTGFSECICNP